MDANIVAGAPKKTMLYIIAGVVLVIILAVVGYFYWANFMKPKTTAAPTAEDLINSATQGTIPSMQTNPLENKVDVNPVDKTNPYANIKTNPF